jgi:hypothetical protein
MYLKKRLLVFSLGALLFTTVQGKEFPKVYDAPVIVTKGEQKKLDKAKELHFQAIAIWNELNARYAPEKAINKKIDSIYNKDAYPKLIKASELFLESNKLRYEVYHDNCQKFWNAHRFDYPQGVEEAKRYQKEAANYMEKAVLNRRAAENYANKYVLTYDRIFEAVSLEIIAGKKEARALQYYQDWPVKYPYVFDEDVEVDLFNPKAVVVAEKPKEEPKKDTVVIIKYVTVEPHDSTIIFYRLQIAAHTVKITKEYIRANIYTGDMKIEEIKEDGWYKYLIGKYKTLDEANKLLAECRSKNQLKDNKTFVVAYRNGKRVQIKEAQTGGK